MAVFKKYRTWTGGVLVAVLVGFLPPSNTLAAGKYRCPLSVTDVREKQVSTVKIDLANIPRKETIGRLDVFAHIGKNSLVSERDTKKGNTYEVRFKIPDTNGKRELNVRFVVWSKSNEDLCSDQKLYRIDKGLEIENISDIGPKYIAIKGKIGASSRKVMYRAKIKGRAPPFTVKWKLDNVEINTEECRSGTLGPGKNEAECRIEFKLDQKNPKKHQLLLRLTDADWDDTIADDAKQTGLKELKLAVTTVYWCKAGFKNWEASLTVGETGTWTVLTRAPKRTGPFKWKFIWGDGKESPWDAVLDRRYTTTHSYVRPSPPDKPFRVTVKFTDQVYEGKDAPRCELTGSKPVTVRDKKAPCTKGMKDALHSTLQRRCQAWHKAWRSKPNDYSCAKGEMDGFGPVRQTLGATERQIDKDCKYASDEKNLRFVIDCFHDCFKIGPTPKSKWFKCRRACLVEYKYRKPTDSVRQSPDINERLPWSEQPREQRRLPDTGSGEKCLPGMPCFKW